MSADSARHQVERMFVPVCVEANRRDEQQ